MLLGKRRKIKSFYPAFSARRRATAQFVRFNLALLLLFNVMMGIIGGSKEANAALVNLALNKTFTASANPDDTKNVVDGDTTTYWFGDFGPGWLAVDLGEETDFNKWTVTAFRLTKFSLETSNDGVNYSPINDPNAVITADGAHLKGAYSLSDTVSARYVRLNITETLGPNQYKPLVYEFGLYMATVPDPPTNVSASAGNGQAIVSFTAPANDGGSPITEYTVTSSPGGLTATGTSSPIKITGLTNGTAYTFTVTATNSVGTSEPSAASDSVTPYALSAVQYAPADNATGVALDTQLSVTFSDTVEAVEGKFIYLREADGTLVENIDAASSQVQVADKTVTITLSDELLPLKGYHVLIDAGAFRHSEDDVHDGIADKTVWNFATAADPDADWILVSENISSGNASYPVMKAGEDGTLYVLFKDQEENGYATVLKMGPNDSQWSPVGERGFSSGAIGKPSLLVEGSTLYAAFGVDTSVQVMKYDLNVEGQGWSQVGDVLNDASGADYSEPSLVMHNGTLYVGYRDGIASMTVKRLSDGEEWVTVGDASFTGGPLNFPSLAVVDGTLYAIFQDSPAVNNKATVMRFHEQSGDWVYVGDRGFTPGMVFRPSLVTDGQDLVIVYLDSGYKAAAMRYDSVSEEWVAASGEAGFSDSQAYDLAAIYADGDIYAVYQDASNGYALTVKKYAGGVWAGVGRAGFAEISASVPSLVVHDGVPYVVYARYSSTGELTVMKYGVSGDSEPDPGPGPDPGPDPGPEPDPEDSTISPTTATFDKNKNSENYKDIVVEVALKGNTYENLWNGQKQLGKGTDYTLTEDEAKDTVTVTILKSYLEKQEVGNLTLTFKLSAGQDQTLTLTIKDTTLDTDTPVLQSAVPGNAKVTVTWSPIIGATEYKVYTSVTSATYGTVSGTVTGSVYNYTVTNLTNGTTYYFTVTAVKDGVESGHSNKKSATPFTVPGKPTNVTAVAGNGKATVTFTPPSDNGGSEITGYKVTASPGGLEATGTTTTIVINGLTNGVSYTFTVVAINEAGSSVASNPSNAVVPSAPTNNGGDWSGPEPIDQEQEEQENTQPAENSVIVLINGKEEQVGTVTTSTLDNQTVTTVIVDADKLNAKLAEEGQGAVVTIPVTTGSDVVVGELNGQMVKNMEDKQAVLEIRTDRATYTLPAEQINIGAVLDQIGQSVALQDIKVQIEIAEPTADQVEIVKNAADEGTFTLVVPPLAFTVKAAYGDSAIEVSKFNAYVERMIAIPDGTDPNRITTGVVVEPDGTVRHVSTKVIQIDGKYYAQINSLTNSMYTVVWHPLEFGDVANHWAKDAVNDMGSRMVIEGAGNGLFYPDRDMTRAEFAAIIVRALGLKPENGTSVFLDVKESDWYSSAVNTAYAYGLVDGFDDGTFRPNDKVTREQAMVILSKAMTITGLKAKLPVRSADAVLRSYTDAADVSDWAQSSVADSVQAGIVSGRSGTALAPKDFITRAEVAAMVKRLLQKSDLI